MCSSIGGGSNELAVATPTQLAGSNGWSSAQTLTLLVALLILALIFVPAFMWRRLKADGGEP